MTKKRKVIIFAMRQYLRTKKLSHVTHVQYENFYLKFIMWLYEIYPQYHRSENDLIDIINSYEKLLRYHRLKETTIKRYIGLVYRFFYSLTKTDLKKIHELLDSQII